MASSSLHTCSG
eukprot:CCRYP_017686-RE/>CCRYP_017686-RE protein AED:0.50 eAED:0.50 QI:0/-1/0/1/-1/0/1/0/11